MIRKAIIVIIFVFLLPQSGLFAITKPKHYNITGAKITKKHIKKVCIRIYSSYNCYVGTKIYSVIFYEKS